MIAMTARNPLTNRMIKIDGRVYKRVNKLKNSIFDFNAIVKQQLQRQKPIRNRLKRSS